MSDKQTKQTWTLQEIADRWGCSHSTVLSHVYGGELRAIDISTNPARRSNFIVPNEALLDFEGRREVPPPEVPESRRKRVKMKPNEVIEFFT